MTNNTVYVRTCYVRSRILVTQLTIRLMSLLAQFRLVLQSLLGNARGGGQGAGLFSCHEKSLHVMKTVHAEAGSVHEGAGLVLFPKRGGGRGGNSYSISFIKS